MRSCDRKKEISLRPVKPGVGCNVFSTLVRTVLRRPLAHLALSLALFSPGALFAWSEHPLGAYPALAVLPEIAAAPPVQVERLEDFLRAEEVGLARALAEDEQWLRRNVVEYPPLPEALNFRAGGPDANRVERFLHALRLNPNIKRAYYVQLIPGRTRADCRRLPAQAVTTLTEIMYMASIRFCELNVGESVSALEVAATASDEPDFGLDIGLYADNKTDYSALYALGEQPFGNPALEYSSQTPFHVGFFQEAWITYKLASFLKRTYPEYRARQYMTLAQYAFQTGHDYWGYRFLGWGLHYIQDLTQPYHSTVAPNLSTFSLLGKSFLNTLGFTGPQVRAVQLLSNRHLALEEFQKRLMQSKLSAGAIDHPIFLAAADASRDAEYGPYSDRYIRDVVTAESNSRAQALDAIIAESMPERLVHDPDYDFDSDFKDGEEDLYARILRERREAEQALSEPLNELFRSFGAHSRNYARHALSARRPSP